MKKRKSSQAPPSATWRELAGPRRRTDYRPAVAEAICSHLRAEGLSDSAAAMREGVCPETIRRWRQRRPAFAAALATARRHFLEHPTPTGLPTGPHPSSPQPPTLRPEPKLAEPRSPLDTRHMSLPASGGTLDTPPGRPSGYCTKIAAAICALIRSQGLSDSLAALRAGASRSAVYRWRRSDPDFAAELELARGEFLHRRHAEIRQARMAAGIPAWRADAWLLQRLYPHEFSRPRAETPAAKPKDQRNHPPSHVASSPKLSPQPTPSPTTPSPAPPIPKTVSAASVDRASSPKPSA